MHKCISAQRVKMQAPDVFGRGQVNVVTFVYIVKATH